MKELEGRLWLTTEIVEKTVQDMYGASVYDMFTDET